MTTDHTPFLPPGESHAPSGATEHPQLLPRAARPTPPPGPEATPAWSAQGPPAGTSVDAASDTPADRSDDEDGEESPRRQLTTRTAVLAIVLSVIVFAMLALAGRSLVRDDGSEADAGTLGPPGLLEVSPDEPGSDVPQQGGAPAPEYTNPDGYRGPPRLARKAYEQPQHEVDVCGLVPPSVVAEALGAAVGETSTADAPVRNPNGSTLSSCHYALDSGRRITLFTLSPATRPVDEIIASGRSAFDPEPVPGSSRGLMLSQGYLAVHGVFGIGALVPDQPADAEPASAVGRRVVLGALPLLVTQRGG